MGQKIRDISDLKRMDEPELDVAACVDLVRSGDESAARAMLRHLQPLVLKIVRAHLPRRSSEEDLVQSVFLKVFTKLDQYRGQVPIEHWVSRIAVNTCLNELSRERVRPEVRHADLSEEEEAVLRNLATDTGELPPEHGIASRELVEMLLDHLKPADRLVIHLLHLEGRSVGEIQKITGWSAPLVKVRAFRARQKLKRYLQILLRDYEP
jgi:RNA polymerase sigma-70 factor (ECF subfamily)